MIVAGSGRNPLGEEDDIEGSVTAINQNRPGKVENRPQQGKEEIAQGGLKRLWPAVQAHKRHGGEGQEFQPNIEREEIASDEDEVQRAPDREQQDPEGEWRSRLRQIFRRREVLARIGADGADDDGGHEHHDRGKPIGAQRHAEGRSPPADEIDDGGEGLGFRGRNRDGNHKAGRQGRERNSLNASSTAHKGQQHACHRDED